MRRGRWLAALLLLGGASGAWATETGGSGGASAATAQGRHANRPTPSNVRSPTGLTQGIGEGDQSGLRLPDQRSGEGAASESRPIRYVPIPRGDPLTASTMDSPGSTGDTPRMAGSSGQWNSLSGGAATPAASGRSPRSGAPPRG